MSTIKKSLLSLAIATSFSTPLVVNAEGFGTFSANVAMTTDYYFRGITQTGNDGALQGGFDWSHDSGFYAGVWGSNVDFGTTNLETDLYAGFANQIGDSGLGYDLTFLRYYYNDSDAGSNDLDTDEWSAKLSYSYFTLGYAYSPDFFGTGNNGKYLSLSFNYDQLPAGLGLSANVGKSFGEYFDVPGGSDLDYIDYKLAISKELLGLNWELAYAGSDLSNTECDGLTGGNASRGYCDDRFILTVSKSIGDTTKAADGADSGISGTITLVSDYYFRGITQADNDGAVQGSFDWSHDSGFYVGLWGSNFGGGGASHVEFDTYAGFANSMGDLGYDLGVIKYNLNDTSAHDDIVEWYANFSYSIFSTGFYYSPSWGGSHDSSKYIYAGVGFDELPMGLAASASIGKSFGDAYEVSGGVDYDYVDYKIGVNKDIVGINFDLSYVGNDLSKDECNSYGYSHSRGNCDDRFILSVSKGF